MFCYLTNFSLFCCRETNLKVRQALPETSVMGEDLEKLKGFNGEYHWDNDGVKCILSFKLVMCQLLI